MRRRAVVLGMVLAAATITLGASSTASAVGAMGASPLPTAAAAPPSSSNPPQVAPFIVGGTDATQVRDYMATIQYPDGRHECGGSLIAPNWVLSAKHCTYGERIVPGTWHVRVGSLDRTTGGTLAGIRAVAAHPLGSPDAAGNDVVLIQLDQAVSQRPIPIATRTLGPGTKTRIFGWGITCDRDVTDPTCATVPTRLQQLDTVIAPDRRCYVTDPVTGTRFFDPRTELCTKAQGADNAQACFGDSGGPQVREHHGREVLVGVTSGDGDDMELRPYVCSTGPDGRKGSGIWEDVSAQHGWITDTMRAHGDHDAADFIARSAA